MRPGLHRSVRSLSRPEKTAEAEPPEGIPNLRGFSLRVDGAAASPLRGWHRKLCCCCLLLPFAYPVARLFWHGSPDDYILADEGGSVDELLKRFRPPLLIRSVVPGNSRSTTLAAIEALDSVYYVSLVGGVKGSPDAAFLSEGQRRRLQQLTSRARYDFVTSQPHTQLSIGSPEHIACPIDPSQSVVCVAWTSFDTDRIPSQAIDRLRHHHAVWLESHFQIRSSSFSTFSVRFQSLLCVLVRDVALKICNRMNKCLF